MTRSYRKFSISTIITLIAALFLAACGAQVRSPIVFPTATSNGSVVIGPDNTAPSCKGTYGTAADGFVVNFDVPAGQTVTYNYVKNGQNRAVEIECPPNGLGVTVKRDYEIPTIGTTTDATGTTTSTFSVTGAPERVDAANVLRAQGKDAYGNVFANATGLGLEMMFAEPGSMLVGPDFDPNKVKSSGGQIEWISPITQQMLGTQTFDTNTAEGAFTWASGSRMTVKVDDYTIKVDGNGCENWFVVIRGLFADGKQDSDRNSTTHFSGYVPGHTQVMWYPQGAFISEGNFFQVSELSHTGGRNCGAEGASKLSVLTLDLNTGAYAVATQANLGQPWKAVESNWR